MEQHVRLVVLEHLRDELDVHVLHVDLLLFDQLYAPTHCVSNHYAYLETLVQHHDSFIELLLHLRIRVCCDKITQARDTYNIGDDTREQLALLVFVGAFLMLSQYLYSYDMPRGKPLHTIMNFKMTVNNWSLR